MYTKKQLMSQLDALNVSYLPKANLATLQALCAQHGVAIEEPAVAETEHTEVDTAPQTDAAPAAEVEQPEVAPVSEPTAPATSGLKIEKDRPEQHGVKRPSAGGKCRAVWDACDELAQGNVASVTSKMVRDHAATLGWNANNASIEFYQWRKYHGVTGRQQVAKTA
jgi:hypothetical protein